MLLSSLVLRSSRIAGQFIPAVRKAALPCSIQIRPYVYMQAPPGGWTNVRDFGNEDDDELEEGTTTRIPMGNFREHTPAEDYSGEQSDMEDYYDITMPGGNEVMDMLAEEDANSFYYTSSDLMRDVELVADSHGAEEFYGYRMEHEKRKDKRRRIANMAKGRRACSKVYGLVDLINIRREYRPKKSVSNETYEEVYSPEGNIGNNKAF